MQGAAGRRPIWRLWPLACAAALALAGCGGGGRSTTPSSGAGSSPAAGPIHAVGAENAYADVISQVGGRYVQVAAIERNPNTDPHTFEATAKVAAELAAARLVVYNGLGYDAWAPKMLAASPNAQRRVIDVQALLRLPTATPDPHLWYRPATMPAVAKRVAADLAILDPAHAAYFRANAGTFDASLRPWAAALARFKTEYAGTKVAVTEPVGDYLLQAAGCDIATPWSLQAAVMNGTDPTPQDLAVQRELLTGHQAKVFLYNQQVTDSLTQSLQRLARREGIPVVGVYETMPAGYTYQSWMLAETNALERAVATGASTTKL